MENNRVFISFLWWNLRVILLDKNMTMWITMTFFTRSRSTCHLLIFEPLNTFNYLLTYLLIKCHGRCRAKGEIIFALKTDRCESTASVAWVEHIDVIFVLRHSPEWSLLFHCPFNAYFILPSNMIVLSAVMNEWKNEWMNENVYWQKLKT